MKLHREGPRQGLSNETKEKKSCIQEYNYCKNWRVCTCTTLELGGSESAFLEKYRDFQDYIFLWELRPLFSAMSKI